MSHAVLQVTDLAVTAKLLGALDGAAFVTDLATGRPRGGVTVLQRDPTGIVVGRGVTNGDGIATLSRIADSPRPPPITQVTVAPNYPRVTVLEATTADDHVSIALGGGAGHRVSAQQSDRREFARRISIARRSRAVQSFPIAPSSGRGRCSTSRAWCGEGLWARS